MKNPELSWYLISAEDSIIIEKEHYLGAYTPDTIEMITNLQLWNNRYGQEIAKDIENSNLKITFSSIEDTKLLEYMQVKIDNNPYEDISPSLWRRARLGGRWFSLPSSLTMRATGSSKG